MRALSAQGEAESDARIASDPQFADVRVVLDLEPVALASWLADPQAR